jgi:hypothetical protein
MSLNQLLAALQGAARPNITNLLLQLVHEVSVALAAADKREDIQTEAVKTMIRLLEDRVSQNLTDVQIHLQTEIDLLAATLESERLRAEH